MSPSKSERILRGFEWDGSWRDIVIRDWSIAKWDEFIRWIVASNRPFEFSMIGETAPLPTFASELFKGRDRASPLLSMSIGVGVGNCHFFGDSDFEMDVDPRRHQTPETLMPLLEFVADLGRAMHRSVLITHESSPELVIAEFNLATECFVITAEPPE